ncbi:hypothetical protein EDB83DRAFT_235135 [Lactarius deliciosus]|nr:hypothetical protein EDB83DRAFT_235135 [Lactarius deliciosus]
MSLHDSPALSLSPLSPSLFLLRRSESCRIHTQLLSFHPHHMPLILYPLALLARFAYVRHSVATVSLCSSRKSGPKGSSGSLCLSKEAWEPSESKASHWLLFVAELPSCTGVNSRVRVNVELPTRLGPHRLAATLLSGIPQGRRDKLPSRLQLYGAAGKGAEG